MSCEGKITKVKWRDENHEMKDVFILRHMKNGCKKLKSLKGGSWVLRISYVRIRFLRLSV